jgi:hypothetical protein
MTNLIYHLLFAQSEIQTPNPGRLQLLIPIHTILGVTKFGTMGTRATTKEFGKGEAVTRG